METMYFDHSALNFMKHPKFSGVKLAVLVKKADTDTVSVSVLDIGPGEEVPVHTHGTEVDSIYVAGGEGQGYVNGSWQTMVTGDYLFVPPGVEHGIRNTGETPLRLFVHHSPPLL